MNLTTKFENLEKSAVKLSVTISKEDIAAAYKKTMDKYIKQAQIPGFRRGHVPAAVLERKFGEGIKADATSEIIDKAMNEIFADDAEKERRPLPYAQPVMESLPALDVTQDMSFSVTYDIFPTVDVKNISTVTVKEPQVEISDADMEDELKAVQERNAIVIDKKDDEAAQNSDIATISYVELDTDGNEIADTKREDFVFTVGDKTTAYKFDDDILGMKKGDEKIVEKTVGEGDNAQPKKFRVKLSGLRVRQLPALDDDLAQDVSEKFKTLDDLKADIKKNMEIAKNRRLRELKNNELLSELVEKNPFEIPASMLDAELDGRWRMMASQFQTTPERLERLLSSSQTKADMLKEWSPQSEKALKSRIIVDTLMKARNISVTPEEVEAEYQRIADEGGANIDEVKKHYEDARAKEYLVDEVKEQKLYDELYKEVKVVKGDKIAFADLFKQN